MAKQLALTDFRAVRRVLEPEDFALGAEQPDPPPSDSISEKSWTGIMSLPDDVAIRTSDHNGKALGQVYWLWGKWIEAIGETAEVPWFDPMLDAGDDLQSAMFNALHGYYRAAFAGLRNVLEAVTIGTCGILAGSPQYANYRAGATEFSFGNACDRLANEPKIEPFNATMREAGFQALWDPRDAILAGGFVRRQYRDLCNYAHTRPGFAEANLWKSNGPLYRGEVFLDWYHACLLTVSLSALSLLVAGGGADREVVADLFIDYPNLPGRELQQAFRLSGIGVMPATRAELE